MMKRLTLTLSVYSLILASCSKFLDQNPNSVAADETTWKSEGDVNASITSCYSLIRSSLNATLGFYVYGDLPSDEFSNVVGNDQLLDIYNMKWNASIPPANNDDARLRLRLFTNFYTAITQSNRCLHFISNMPLTAFDGIDSNAQRLKENKYLGEAYFTRAFNYFYISRIWGDVPLVTDYIDDIATAPKLTRSPQAEVLAHAINDANLARQLLPLKDGSSTDRNVRADKGAAFALLAHIYAWQGKYDSCSMFCDSIIGSGSYTLTGPSTYMSIYKGQSPESIFEITGNTINESQSALSGYSITGVTLTPPYLLNGPVQPVWAINATLLKSMFNDTSDVRYQKAFTQITTGAGANIFECIKYANVVNVNNNPAYAVSLNNTIIFRLSDILLLKAEALAAKASPDPAGALALVNRIRFQRDISKPLEGIAGPQLLTTIADERYRELFLEGSRFYDLVRLERLTGEEKFPNMTHAEFIAGRYYWPIDPTLQLLNPLLAQTPFWVGKIR